MIEVACGEGESLIVGDCLISVMEIDGDEVLLRMEGIDEEDIKYLDDDAVERGAIESIA